MKYRRCVYLVGTGPGDPELLTLKALRVINDADVIVYDRLVSQEVIEQIPSGVAKIYVGKSTGEHTLSQDEINRLLVNLHEKNHSVVRLKGGDPFVFGRGGEEALFLSQHAVPFEVVPGVTAANAAAAYAGIPLTHRGLAHGVQIITGHAQSNQPLALDWQKLADPDTTLVIYMGLSSIVEIVGQLITHGLAASTPIAAIENGTTPQQRRVITTLGKVAGHSELQAMKPPVLFIIGQVVELAHTLDWFQAEYLQQAAYNGQAGAGG